MGEIEELGKSGGHSKALSGLTLRSKIKLQWHGLWRVLSGISWLFMEHQKENNSSAGELPRTPAHNIKGDSY